MSHSTIVISIPGEETLTVSAAEALADPTRLLHDVSVALASFRSRQHGKMRGSTLKVGPSYKGTVTAVQPDRTLSLTPAPTAPVPLTAARARQLLPAETTRK